VSDHAVELILNWISAHGWHIFWALFFIAGASSVRGNVNRG